MKLVKLSDVIEGSVLASPISNNNIVLVQKGVPLTKLLIAKLIQLGLKEVFIEIPLSSSPVKKKLTDEIREKSVTLISNCFTQIQNKDSLKQYLVIEESYEKFVEIINSIQNDILHDQELLHIFAECYIVDNYIFTHSFNVAVYSLGIGAKLGLTKDELHLLGLCSILHDVGKMLISPSILLKTGPLTEEEFLEMKMHTEKGYELLKSVPTLPSVVAKCALYHHEKLDGTGYPIGLRGSNIPFFARIIAVADVFDALTANRVYKKGLSIRETIHLLERNTHIHFDWSVVNAFKKIIALYSIGTVLCTNNGKKGVVVSQNVDDNTRPIIKVFEEHGKKVPIPYLYNLAEFHDVPFSICS